MSIKDEQATLSDDDIELIRQLREAGLLIRDIAEKFEISFETVRSIVQFHTRNKRGKL